VARYRAADYTGSAAAFAEHGDTRNLYNLGNALARQGEFESAIDAYEQVLEQDPDHDDAQYNRDLLKQMLEQQQADQNQRDEQESSEQADSDSEPSDSNSSASQQDSDDTSQAADDSADSDASQRGGDETNQEDLEALKQELERAAELAEQQAGQPEQQMTQAELEELRRQQEQQQAMEQWLRRIPNDPGGLLRRKFRYQYQKSGKDQDGNNTWPDDEVRPW
jgi:Ca-activated chloride channel family protein